MRRIEPRHDCRSPVSLGSRDGDCVVGDEYRGDIRKGGVSVAENVDERKPKLRRLDIALVNSILQKRTWENQEPVLTLKSGTMAPGL